MGGEGKAKARRRRWPWVLLGLFLLFVVALLLTPGLAAPWVRDKLVSSLEERLAVKAEIEELSFSWSGASRLSGLALETLDGRPLAQIAEVDVDVAVLSLLRKQLRAVATVSDLEAHARRAADGSFDWQELPRRPAEPAPGAGTPTETSPSDLHLALDLNLERMALHIEDETHGQIEARDVNGRVELRYPEGNNQVELEADVLRDSVSAGAMQLDLTAPLELGDLQIMLAGARGDARISLSAFTTPEVDSQGGELKLNIEDGRARIEGRFDANDGPLTLDGDLALVPSADRATTLRFDAPGSEARAGLAPLLSYLHPAFATLDSVQGGVLSGSLSTAIQLEYPGTDALSELASGALSFDPALLSGDGRFGLGQAGIGGSPLVDQLLEMAGAAAGETFDLAAFPFSIREGALTYDEPWDWNIGGLATAFAGSVGFDQGLDLIWTLPLTEEFLKKQGLPKELAGRTLVLPIGGTATSPDLDWNDSLEKLAKDALQDELSGEVDELEQRLREEVGGLLGGGGGDDDPAQLLRRADELWEAGTKAEAQVLYKRIREDFKLSPTYLLNRDKIKKRAKGG